MRNQVKNSFRGKAAKNPIKTRVGFLSHAVVQLSWDFYGIVGELRKRSQVKLTATRLYLISGNMKCDISLLSRRDLSWSRVNEYLSTLNQVFRVCLDSNTNVDTRSSSSRAGKSFGSFYGQSNNRRK